MILIYQLAIGYKVNRVVLVDLDPPEKSTENYWLSIGVPTDSWMLVSLAKIESQTMSFVNIIVELELVQRSGFYDSP